MPVARPARLKGIRPFIRGAPRTAAAAGAQERTKLNNSWAYCANTSGLSIRVAKKRPDKRQHCLLYHGANRTFLPLWIICEFESAADSLGDDFFAARASARPGTSYLADLDGCTIYPRAGFHDHDPLGIATHEGV